MNEVLAGARDRAGDRDVLGGNVVVDAYRRMVAEEAALVDVGGDHPGSEIGGAKLVVDAPPHIVFAGPTSVGPPRVQLGFGGQALAGFDKARCYESSTS